MANLPHWPYPRWVAHRGAGKLAPENTMAAFRLGASFGYRMFECDAKLSRDGVLFLLHDTDLKRTTNAQGTASERTFGELAQLDAGSWHSRTWAGESLPTLEALARWCLANHYGLNVEIKPTPGQALATGRASAALMKRIWPADSVQPLFTSFQPDALRGAQEIAPHIPRGLLVDQFADGTGHADVKTALALDCQALVLNQALWTQPLVQQVHAQGLRAGSYTVNDEWAAERLLALGVDAIITDRVDLFSPAAA